MKVSVILAHPNKASFNHAMAETVVAALKENGHEVIFHDLYQENFDPIFLSGEEADDAVLPPEIKKHCKEISDADGIIIIHPVWWGAPPAILMGWVDRVMRPGVAIEFVETESGEGIPKGLLKARNAIVFNTSNTDPEMDKTLFGEPLEKIWKNCIFNFCGVEQVQRKVFTPVITSAKEQREKWLKETRETVVAAFG